MADFFREIPTFELKFSCNFKGCLDSRPMSMMGAIEHQAFHFCETFKTQVHFNFKCDFCNVYHVNKSHHRLCINDPTGQGHTSFLRSVFTVPMSDQEYHDCIDFSRFASQHMLAVTAEGVRLVPEGNAGPLPQYKFEPAPDASETNTQVFHNNRSTSGYRDNDNNSNAGDNKYSGDNKFGRSGGDFSDRNDSRDYRGRGGRGGFRGRGERGRFFRGGRGRGGGRYDGDGDNGYGGRDNEYRRGRGRGGGSNFRDNGGDSFRSRGNDNQFQRNRSYSRSRSGSPVAAAKPSGGFNNARARSYSRSGSGSPPPARNTNKGGGAARGARSYSRSGSSSPPPAKKQNAEAASRSARSYSRSQSGSPPPKLRSPPAPVKHNRPPASYSRSESSSDAAPRNDENNNTGQDDQENTQPNAFTKNEDYMSEGYGCKRISTRGRTRTTSTTAAFAADDTKGYHQNRQSRLDTHNQYNDDRFAERVAKEKRERSYSKSPSSSP